MVVEIREYLTRDGWAPFSEWLSALPLNARAQIRTRLDRLELGDFSSCLPVGDGVFELWVHVGPGYRVYYAVTGCVMVLLLCGSDDSVRNRDIIRAKLYWHDYELRTDGEE